MSSFSWLDYDEHDRRRMLDIVSMFSERETRDELGVGSIRDAFADMLFPGTSTIQTRARYFLFIPWMYLRLEREGVRSSEIAKRARKCELQLIPVIEESEDAVNNIGRIARDDLRRLPSNIYWLGLKRWGICQFYGSQDQYHRSLDTFYEHTGRGRRYSDDGRGELLVSSRGNWDSHLPQPPINFPLQASLRLESHEAVYLRNCIQQAAQSTLLAFLVTDCQTTDWISAPWLHPQYAQFPEHIREQLYHARNFAESIHGAALLYNLLLAEARESAELVNTYTLRLAEWVSRIGSRLPNFESWNITRFWSIVRGEDAHIPALTVQFVEQWLTVVTDPSRIHTIHKDARARELVRHRERFLKGQQARLINQRALAQWTGAAGADMLNFRWPTAWRIITDIQEGLLRGATHA